jgi:ergothioneine biosynthesis protein EgtB
MSVTEAGREFVATGSREALLARFRRVRQASITMCRPLRAEDFRLQPIEEVSPPWWNLGHTSWFFVRNVLEPFGGRLVREDAQYDFLLNSYYASLGSRLPRSRRGSITRPTTEEIYRYRASVDQRVEDLLETVDPGHLDALSSVLAIGLEHEQQHQELFYTEIKVILAQNLRELRQPYRAVPEEERPVDAVDPLRFVDFAGGLLEFGHRGQGWCWDNELPVHKFYLAPFALANRLVTNAEYQEFLDDHGYDQQLLWLDNGWARLQGEGWHAPLYWERVDGCWWLWTLDGMRPLPPEEPVCHVSFYEADAFARWKSQTAACHRGVRLPTEREWEQAARSTLCEPQEDAFLESDRLHPACAKGGRSLAQMAGCLWQWTSSYYEPYPGYRPFLGVLAEYNGKFMDNQRVLRGGSCVTPREHFRVSYRNFWSAPTRFQFTGIRLVRSEE